MSRKRDEVIMDAVGAFSAAGFAEVADDLTFAVISPALVNNLGRDDGQLADRMREAGMPGEYAAIVERSTVLGDRVVAFGDVVKVSARWDRDTVEVDPAVLAADTLSHSALLAAADEARALNE